jgi:hypothetical protein
MVLTEGFGPAALTREAWGATRFAGDETEHLGAVDEAVNAVIRFVSVDAEATELFLDLLEHNGGHDADAGRNHGPSHGLPAGANASAGVDDEELGLVSQWD